MKKSTSRIQRVFSNRKIFVVLLFITGLALGLGVGYVLWQAKDHDPRYRLASGSEIKTAKKEITDKFLAQSSTACSDGTDPIKPADRVKVFEDYLKVNKYGNRAVIRGCGDIDTLLAKDPLTGQWEGTTVNMSLDTRANPAWQVECLIDDITRPDDVIRSENTGIDVDNLIACRSLKENELVARILLATDFAGLKLDQDTIDFYINGE